MSASGGYVTRGRAGELERALDALERRVETAEREARRARLEARAGRELAIELARQWASGTLAVIRDAQKGDAQIDDHS